MNRTTTVAASLVAIAACIGLTVSLAPDQSQAGAIQYGIPLLAVAAWVWLRGSRAALITATVLGVLFSALSTFILVTDIADGVGARQLGPDALVLVAALTAAVSGVRAVRHRQLAHA